MIRIATILTAGLLTGAVAATPPPEAPPPTEPEVEAPDGPLDDLERDPRFGLLTPIPAHGGIPPIVERLRAPTESARTAKILANRYAKDLRQIKRRYFGSVRDEAIRTSGHRRLREFVDPSAFQPMIEVLQDEAPDVQVALLEHFATLEGPGQAAITWAAVHATNLDFQARALDHLTAPAGPESLAVLDRALRSDHHGVANNAGLVAGSLHAIETIPLLIFGQTAPGPGAGEGEQGDIAWIAIQQQQAYVQNLVPVVGDNSGAFQPVIGVVTEGLVLRVMDAVAIIYRTYVHESLVNMTSYEWGRSTEHLGYDREAWWAWYNQEFVPHVNEKRRQRDIAGG